MGRQLLHHIRIDPVVTVNECVIIARCSLYPLLYGIRRAGAFSPYHFDALITGCILIADISAFIG